MESANCAKGISDDKNEQQILLKIAGLIKNIKYGYIQITVHNNKVVQIDKTEKFRLDGQNSKPKGGETYTTIVKG